MQQLLAVAFVLLLLLGAVWLLRKKGFAGMSMGRQTRVIEQLDRMRLTPQHSIHLLRIENRLMLVAVHPRGMCLLDEAAPGLGGKGSAAGS